MLTADKDEIHRLQQCLFAVAEMKEKCEEMIGRSATRNAQIGDMLSVVLQNKVLPLSVQFMHVAGSDGLGREEVIVSLEDSECGSWSSTKCCAAIDEVAGSFSDLLSSLHHSIEDELEALEEEAEEWDDDDWCEDDDWDDDWEDDED